MGRPRITLDDVEEELRRKLKDEEGRILDLSVSTALSKLDGFNGLIYWEVNCENSRHKIYLEPTGTLHFAAHPKAIDWEVEIPSNQIIHEEVGGTGFACRCAQVRDAWKGVFEEMPLSTLPGSVGTTFAQGGGGQRFRFNEDGQIILERSPVTMRRAAMQLLALRKLRKVVYTVAVMRPSYRNPRETMGGLDAIRPLAGRRTRTVKRNDPHYSERFGRRVVQGLYQQAFLRRWRLYRDAKSARYYIYNKVVEFEGGGHGAANGRAISLWGCRIPALLKISQICILVADFEHQARWLEHRDGSIRVSYFKKGQSRIRVRQGWADYVEERKQWRVIEDEPSSRLLFEDVFTPNHEMPSTTNEVPCRTIYWGEEK